MPESTQGASPNTSTVPCNGCTLCCQGHQVIILHPEYGDDPALHQTVEITHPLTGEPALMVAQKANGDCINLTEKGCRVYENRPAMCKEYDCRKQYMSLTKAMRREMVERGIASQSTFDAGKRRLDSLTGPERQECISRRKATV